MSMPRTLTIALLALACFLVYAVVRSTSAAKLPAMVRISKIRIHLDLSDASPSHSDLYTLILTMIVSQRIISRHLLSSAQGYPQAGNSACLTSPRGLLSKNGGIQSRGIIP